MPHTNSTSCSKTTILPKLPRDPAMRKNRYSSSLTASLYCRVVYSNAPNIIAQKLSQKWELTVTSNFFCLSLRWRKNLAADMKGMNMYGMFRKNDHRTPNLPVNNLQQKDTRTEPSETFTRQPRLNCRSISVNTSKLCTLNTIIRRKREVARSHSRKTTQTRFQSGLR